ncbi:MAG: TatD family deoxyribonuclease [Gammaproteobacteria bacterium]|nr:TatD family deoxyribonuclease [Gammaproteobacteria bacterium]
MRLIDIGANLADAAFDVDRDEVIERAAAAGVRHMIVTGTGLKESESALAVAEQNSGVFRCTAGIHPHLATRWTDAPQEARERLGAALGSELAVAGGECGLDYFRNLSPPDAQREAFAGQLELAAEHGKPVFLHQRDAHDDFLAILKEHDVSRLGGVAHCFTGGPAEAESYLGLGLYIGITGWVLDQRRNHELLKAIPVLPLDRVLLETDSPYLLPRHPDVKPQRKRRNEPEFLPYVARALAYKMRVDPEELAAAVRENTHRLFGWPEPEVAP